MENDNGKSYYGIGLDNSQLEQDAAKANQILHGIDEEAERQSAAVRDLLSNIPTINIDIVSNAPTTLESIDAAFAAGYKQGLLAAAPDRDYYKTLAEELQKEINRLNTKISVPWWTVPVCILGGAAVGFTVGYVRH